MLCKNPESEDDGGLKRMKVSSRATQTGILTEAVSCDQAPCGGLHHNALQEPNHGPPLVRQLR